MADRKSTRRGFLRLAGMGAVSAGLVRPAAARPPNIVILYVDDMGWGELGCYGGKLAPTPHIDALAANGIRFTNGYIAACVCAPSRVGLMTGRYQARTGHDANTTRPGTELDIGEITMAQYLKRAGYATAIVGKWHLGSSDPKFLPQSRGFDFSVGTVSNLGENGFYRGLQLIDDLPGAPVTTPFYTREAIGFIEKNRANPFFLYLPFNAVHAPHVASEKWLDRFAKVEDRRQRSYAALIGEMDDGIGAVMAKLRSLGLEENTLIFCISDNGGPEGIANNGGLRGGKWNLYEGGTRVPYMVQWKGRIRPGQVSDVPVIQLDVLPTVLAASGGTAKPEKEIDGVNLLPLLEGRQKSIDRTLFWRFGVQLSARKGDWKVLKPSAEDAPRLYNLASDRGESKDLWSAEPERAKALWAEAQGWSARMKPPRWEDRRWGGQDVRRKLMEEKRAGKKGKKG